MADNMPEENREALSTAEEVVEPVEGMEVTMTTQLESLNVTQGDTHVQGETADAHTQLAATFTSQETARGAKGTSVEASVRTQECVAVGRPEHSEDSDSDSSSSSSTSSSTPVVRALAMDEDDDEGFSQPAPIKTRDEVLLEELPAVEEVCVSLPEDAELQPIGTVSSIIQQLVIVQSLKGTPPLTDDSLVFNSERLVVGKVFEVFGPVSSPFYVLRFNSEGQISAKGLAVGCTVYYTPAIKEFTGYILTQKLQLLRGSDASWKNDQEPPAEALDYSDDEEEQEAKRKKRQKPKKDNNNADNFPQITHNSSVQKPQQQHDHRGFLPRRAPPPFRNQPHTAPFQHGEPRQPPHGPPAYLPPQCPYPPPPHHFPPPAFPLYPPPPPHHHSFSPHFPPPSLWSTHPLHHALHFPPPPPPPPPQ